MSVRALYPDGRTTVPGVRSGRVRIEVGANPRRVSEAQTADDFRSITLLPYYIDTGSKQGVSPAPPHVSLGRGPTMVCARPLCGWGLPFPRLFIVSGRPVPNGESIGGRTRRGRAAPDRAVQCWPISGSPPLNGADSTIG